MRSVASELIIHATCLMGRREQRERERKRAATSCKSIEHFLPVVKKSCSAQGQPATVTLLVQLLYMLLYSPLLFKIPPLAVLVAISRHHLHVDLV